MSNHCEINLASASLANAARYRARQLKLLSEGISEGQIPDPKRVNFLTGDTADMLQKMAQQIEELSEV